MSWVMIRLVILFVSIITFGDALQLFVDGKNGDDNNPGTLEKPFATITKAQSTIRALQGNIPAGGVQVEIRAGDYFFFESPLQFTSADSGKNKAEITYMAYQNEKVRFLAGKIIPSSAFLPVQPGSNILATDLTKFGITSYGELSHGGLGSCNQNQLEVFINSKPLIIARYPNIDNGYWTFDNLVKVISQTEVAYNGTRPSRWTQAKDLWLHGYWSFDWADSYVKVTKIDPTTSTFTIDSATPPVYGFEPKARYYALNLLEELDAPNEYYIDRSTGVLYIYPPTPLSANDDIAVSVGSSVLTVTGTQYLIFKNLVFSFARETGIVISGDNIQIVNCDISNHGRYGIDFSGTNSVISSNTVSYSGCGGIGASGGDQKTLTPGNIIISQNEISYYARIVRTYTPGVHLSGVGHVISGNFIHDAPHNGILTGVNNCIFEGNHLKNLCYEVSDSGAFYTGRSWIQRGNVVQKNIFENIYNIVPTVLGWLSVQAVYLDDQMSGYKVDSNRFINCQTGIVVGGGRRNIVTNNNFLNCSLDIHFDNRGMNWQNATCVKGGEFEQELISVNYQKPPWSTTYPELVNIMQDHPCVPVYNQIATNTYCDSPTFISASPAEITSWLSTATDNNPQC